MEAPKVFQFIGDMIMDDTRDSIYVPPSYDHNNIFAKILRKEVVCDFLDENEYAVAFYDLYPKAPTHVLIVPKGSYQNSLDFYTYASMQEISSFYQLVGRVAQNLGLNADVGFNLLSNCGTNAGQQIHHFHVHLLSGQKLNF